MKFLLTILLLALSHVAIPKLAVVTAYCLRGPMASGKYVYDGAVSVDPVFYRLGSLIKIGKRIYKAEDTGRDIKGPGRFDIWMSRCKDAIDFGVHRLPYQIIKR